MPKACKLNKTYNEQSNQRSGEFNSDSIKRCSVTNDIDQFLIPNTVEKLQLPFDSYDYEFSSEAYRIACKAVLQNKPSGTCDLGTVRGAIANLDKIL